MLTNQAIEVTCTRLIEKVADELNRLNCNSNNDQEDTLLVTSNSNAENMVNLDPDTEENIESIIIEEFGKCLLDIIDTAEKR